jgi:hypothetical protein
MSLFAMRRVFIVLALISIALCGAKGSTSQRAAEPLATDPGWPRQYTDGTAKLVLWEPQVDSWADFRKLKARFAVQLTPGRDAQPVWGTLSIESVTDVDMEARTVALTDFKVTSITYPVAKGDSEAEAWQGLTTRLLPPYPTIVLIERILAYMDKDQVQTRQAPVLIEPPPILVSMQPAVLVIIDGEPICIDIDKTSLQKVVNTNWDLFFDKQASEYFLRDDMHWFSAKHLTDDWKAVFSLPEEFSRLPDTEQYDEVRKAAAKPQMPKAEKRVLVTNKPSELIVISGEPQLQPIPNTRLMWVSNTECDLFFYTEARQFFFLTSGRWFRTTGLKSNQWTAATSALPEDFKRIPPDHPRSHVLAAVPGTQQAQDAAISASIPQVATVNRKSVQAEVKYVGDPKFESIAGTRVWYASNTPNDVFRLEGEYYLCLDGVWFLSSNPNGPWVAADKVPKEIYEIPPSSPKYNVTYVTVYNSTPETITYGYSAGYTGMYVGYGVAMWGTGYYYPPYYATGYYPYPIYWPCPYYTYGASAWYNPATGAYGRGSAVYGPYGGYARAAAYNPATGGYAWGRSAWGPYGAAATGGFYNPKSGTWGGTYHASNGYQSWGQSVVSRGNQSARTASYADSRGAVGGMQRSGGGTAIAARGSQGQGFAGKSAAGDIYAGKDGNVYKRDTSSGQWYKNSSGSWQAMNRPTSSNGQSSRIGQPAMGQAAITEGSPDSGAKRESIQSGLNRDASARAQGNYNAQRSQAARQSSGWSSGGWTAPRSTGWSVRSPGFGRRR